MLRSGTFRKNQIASPGWILVFGILAAAGYARCPELDSFRVSGCCEAGLADCAKRHPECLLTSHLDAFATWVDTLKKSDPCSARVTDLADRCATLDDTVTHAIDLTHVTFVGEKKSPFRIVLYVSAACPLCKRLYKALYYEVTSGKLRGIATLGIKVISTHGWDVALYASQRFGRQSELLLAIADIEERITTQVVLEKSAAAGISMRELRKAITDPALIAEVKLSKAEASRNEVTVTPTVFIDGVRYRSYKDPQWIVDAVLYRNEKRLRASGLGLRQEK